MRSSSLSVVAWGLDGAHSVGRMFPTAIEYED
jgi:hypothetical protein